MHKVKKLTLQSSAIPADLQGLAQPPSRLFVQGPLDELLAMPRVAIVGSRRVTPYGRAVTLKLAKVLAERGVVVVSGLALGVDSIAHTAALEAGGRTVAVLPSSLETIYPSRHQPIAAQILNTKNVLLSEYEATGTPMKHQFLERNRLIAGLSQAVLIPEAAEKSGSLHTANFALDEGKTIMAVPGNITSELSRGTNNLIRAGATPITSVSDLLEALGLSHQPQQARAPSTPEEAAILDLISTGTSDAGELQALSDLGPAIFNQTLTMLEITGKIQPIGAGHWALK